ncbi:hypothetical protein A3465_17225 [Enterobacter roggenkampii]|nr:hypothetical protein A3465_17225 [Enterobacter roggenkampii]
MKLTELKLKLIDRKSLQIEQKRRQTGLKRVYLLPMLFGSILVCQEMLAKRLQKISLKRLILMPHLHRKKQQ